MAFNYLHSKIVPIYNQNFNTPGFSILVTKGSFKTKRYKDGYNYYTIKYEMYLNDKYISYSRFYNPFDLCKALDIPIFVLETYYKY